MEPLSVQLFERPRMMLVVAPETLCTPAMLNSGAVAYSCTDRSDPGRPMDTGSNGTFDGMRSCAKRMNEERNSPSQCGLRTAVAPRTASIEPRPSTYAELTTAILLPNRSSGPRLISCCA